MEDAGYRLMVGAEAHLTVAITMVTISGIVWVAAGPPGMG